MSEDEKERSARYELLESLGLHYCRKYRNLVMFDEETCGRCPFNTRGKGGSRIT